MNGEALSQLFFDDTYVVPAEQTARRLFRELPPGAAYADHLIEAMATGYLVAVLESMCMRELQACVDPATHAIVGVDVKCRHCAPIAVGTQLRVTGWVQGLGEGDVTFAVQAHDPCGTVCEASIRLAIVRRRDIDRALARKRVAASRAALFAAA